MCEWHHRGPKPRVVRRRQYCCRGSRRCLGNNRMQHKFMQRTVGGPDAAVVPANLWLVFAITLTFTLTLTLALALSLTYRRVGFDL
mmetsp:Transcript_96005/g.214875  ORF Transcript_96005/g.214875 Transcript_96005/m.214875 type:complete len:86 (-) Transcript_96005:198-455(-)